MNQELLAKITSSSQLPTLPVIAIKALELTQKDNVSITEIANLLVNDPALASKILRTVNSPFYGLPKQVSTISHALVILGLQAVKTLALGFSLVNNLTGDQNAGGGFDYMGYWKRSIYSAVASRQICKKFGLVQQEEAFLAGLLAKVGVLVMHRVLGEEFDAVYAQSAGDNDKLVLLCQEKFQLDYADVGGALAEKWQLPPVLTKPIARHRDANPSEGDLDNLIRVVGTGVIIAQIFALPDPALAIAQARAALAERFKFSPEDVEKLLEEIGASTREAAKLFELNIGVVRPYQKILEDAREALETVSLQSQQQVQTISKQVETLQVKATTDTLTGLANRGRFNEFLEEQFNRALSMLRPLAILFLDIDHFKKVNDTYGHDAGDAVLKRLAKVLKASIRTIDLAARYGGEEFAVVLTEADTVMAAARAEAIRKAIASQKIEHAGKIIQITISIGVAGTDRSRVFAQSSQFLNAADRAVYAAKSAGRNAVRVFRPKVEVPSPTPQTQPAAS